MKYFSTLILVALFAVAVLAQRAENNTDEKLRARNAPDVFVHSASAYGPDKDGYSHFTIEIRNTGAKTITGIDWGYSYFRNDAKKDKADAIFRRGVKLLPENKTTLTFKMHYYTNELITGYNLDTVQIMRVEYEDGSSWERPKDKKPSDK